MNNVMSFSPNMGQMEVTEVVSNSLFYVSEPDDRLFEDEGYLGLGYDLDSPLDRYLDDRENEITKEILEFEITMEPMIAKGNILHRFGDDAAVEQYCTENYLDDPIVHKDGKVTAWCSFTNERHQIGWVL